MKKYIVLFFCLNILISCSKQEFTPVEASCPPVYISKEHKDFFYSINEDQNNDMQYIANINNTKIVCKTSRNNSVSSVLDILFIITPLNKDIKEYNFHYFVSIIDTNNNVIDYQIFQTKGNFDLELQPKEVIETLDQYFPIEIEEYYRVFIGFILTDKKYDFINN
tara:strand:+ start:108 stop:602 length:495 start_codon:yes stop_codon:yes gene_type:complete